MELQKEDRKIKQNVKQSLSKKGNKEPDEVEAKELKTEAKDTDYQYSSENSDEASETKDKSEKPKKIKSKESKNYQKKGDGVDDTEGDVTDAMDIEAEPESQPRDTFFTEKRNDRHQYEEEVNLRQEKEDKELERRTQFIGDYNDMRIVEERYNHLWGYYEHEDIEILIESLDERGIREGVLKRKLTKKYPKIVSLAEKRQHELATARHYAIYGNRQTRSTSRSRGVTTKQHAFLYYTNTMVQK